jgi:acyl dehydratase
MNKVEDEVYVGRYYGTHEHEVTEETVRHYCESVAEGQASFDAVSASGRLIAPPLLFHSEVYSYQGWYLPYIFGNLHARQEWQFFAPMSVGDRVTTRSTVVDRYVKRDRQYVVNEVDYAGDDGRPLLRGRTHQSFLMDTSRTDTVVDKSREKRSDRQFDVEEEGAVELLAGTEKVITQEMCEKFSGPHKNYHNDVEEAKKLGFPDIVVQGMMPLCFVADMLAQRFGEGLYVGGRMDIRLVNVLWNGDRAQPRGVVREIVPEGGARRAQMQVWCEKEDGTKVVIGDASAILR